MRATLTGDDVDALIAIGGDDTLGVAGALGEHGVHAVGVPKTIDNDLSATDFTFGFQTAVQVATDAIDRLHTTAESHDRVMVVEVMGRHAGWIAVHSGIAGGAHVVLVPEEPFDVEDVCARIDERHRLGANFSIVVVAEGATPKGGSMTVQSGDVDAFGHVRLGGISNDLAEEIERRTGFETRVTILGHVLRGGTPDRVRPGARHPVRRRGRRRGARRRLRHDGRAARHRDRTGADHRRRRGTPRRSIRSCSPSHGPCSGDGTFGAHDRWRP